jgi:hypothetical protein
MPGTSAVGVPFPFALPFPASLPREKSVGCAIVVSSDGTACPFGGAVEPEPEGPEPEGPAPDDGPAEPFPAQEEKPAAGGSMSIPLLSSVIFLVSARCFSFKRLPCCSDKAYADAMLKDRIPDAVTCHLLGVYEDMV